MLGKLKEDLHVGIHDAKKEGKEHLSDSVSALRHTWNDVFLVSFLVEPEKIQQFLPSRLQVDTYQGKGVISIVYTKTGSYKWAHIPLPKKPYRELILRTYTIDESRRKKGYWYFNRYIDSTVLYEVMKSHSAATHLSKASIKWKTKGTSFNITATVKNDTDVATAFEGHVKDVITPNHKGLLDWVIDTSRTAFFFENNKKEFYEREFFDVEFGKAKALNVNTFSTNDPILTKLIPNLHLSDKETTDDESVFFLSSFSGNVYPEKKVD